MAVKKSVKKSYEKDYERFELLWRILVAIVSGIILAVWRYLIFALAIVNFFIVLFSGKREKGLADFSEYFNTESYRFLRYLTFETNERPFPFNEIKRLGRFV